MKSLQACGAAWVLLAGCYTYRPLGSVDSALPAAGTRVEVRLTAQGTSALAPRVGPDVQSLQGYVVAADSENLTLAVTHAETGRHASIEWKGEHVTLPREYVTSLEERKLSLGATALAGGLAGGGLVAAFTLLGGTGSASGSGGGITSTGPH